MSGCGWESWLSPALLARWVCVVPGTEEHWVVPVPPQPHRVGEASPHLQRGCPSHPCGPRFRKLWTVGNRGPPGAQEAVDILSRMTDGCHGSV